MKALLLLLISYASFAQDVWVNSYYKSDGTYVEGYYRTEPDNTVNNNYSTIGNQNPYTGEYGTKPREPYTNTPAGNIVTPISLLYTPSNYYYNDSEAQRTEDNMRKHLKSPLSTNSQPEMSFSDKMNTLNDNRFNFEEYNIKPDEVYKELPSGELEPLDKPAVIMATPDNEPETDSNLSKIIGVVFGLFCVFLTFIVLLFTKRTKRF
jgi:hypothetical protein